MARAAAGVARERGPRIAYSRRVPHADLRLAQLTSVARLAEAPRFAKPGQNSVRHLITPGNTRETLAFYRPR